MMKKKNLMWGFIFNKNTYTLIHTHTHTHTHTHACQIFRKFTVNQFDTIHHPESVNITLHSFTTFYHKKEQHILTTIGHSTELECAMGCDQYIYKYIIIYTYIYYLKFDEVIEVMSIQVCWSWSNETILY